MQSSILVVWPGTHCVAEMSAVVRLMPHVPWPKSGKLSDDWTNDVDSQYESQNDTRVYTDFGDPVVETMFPLFQLVSLIISSSCPPNVIAWSVMSGKLSNDVNKWYRQWVRVLWPEDNVIPWSVWAVYVMIHTDRELEPVRTSVEQVNLELVDNVNTVNALLQIWTPLLLREFPRSWKLSPRVACALTASAKPQSCVNCGTRVLQSE